MGMPTRSNFGILRTSNSTGFTSCCEHLQCVLADTKIMLQKDLNLH